jgi:gas vesicle protein
LDLICEDQFRGKNKHETILTKTESNCYSPTGFIADLIFIIKHLKLKIMISGKVVIGALAGIAAGALIGVFFAPDKGSESRNKIVKKGEDYLDSIKTKFNSLLDSMAGKYDGGKVEVSDIGQTAKNNSKEAKREAQPTAG